MYEAARKYLRDFYAGLRPVVAYDEGGVLAHDDHVHRSFLSEPEPVLTPAQSAAYRRHRADT